MDVMTFLFSKESTAGVEEGQVTAVSEHYSMPGLEQPKPAAIDYEDEHLRAYDPPSNIPPDKPTYLAD